MLRRTFVFCMAASLAAPAAPTAAQEATFVQDQTHFEKAVRDAIYTPSTAPYYVFITIVDDRSGKRWRGCQPATLLIGAIDKQQRLGVSTKENEHALGILLGNKTHEFHFSEPFALGNLPTDLYNKSDLRRARDFLHDHGPQAFAGQFPVQAYRLNRDALACAIIEAGWSARVYDDAGSLVVAEP